MRRNTGLLFALTVITFIITGMVPRINGGIRVLAQDVVHPDDPYKAREALYERFTARDHGVVLDTKHGLEWFVGPDKDTTWNEAKFWVESLSVDGGGWRMPARDELSSLYTEGAGSQNMSPLLKTTGGFVWTGETVGSTYAWGFCFEIGDAYWPLHTYSETARGFAVRSAKP
ncbi:MAG: DUF1566 domain-containing protein [Deltaproteobacteria bacterium]|nr:DUF1566 domain-containing protein [Deltaproteobacteria bacterium]